jgi:hypothetical protein
MFIERTIGNAQIHSVDRMRSIGILNQEVYTEPLGFIGLTGNNKKRNVCSTGQKFMNTALVILNNEEFKVR